MRSIADIVARRRTLADEQGAFGRTRVYDVRHPDYGRLRVLDVEGTWQSGSYVDERWAELAFEYHRRFAEVLFCADAPPVRSMLVLGGGGLSFPRHVAVHHAGVTSEVVEADPLVIELARRHFFLDALTTGQAARMRVVQDDAASYLGRRVELGVTYDAVVNDVFAAGSVPDSLRGPALARAARAVLTPGGLYLANVIGALVGADAAPLREATRDLAEAFAHVWVVPLGADDPRTPDNNVVIATDGSYVPADALGASELP